MEKNLQQTGENMKRGLVVGKFYPFHQGHNYLINQAKKQVDRLTVLVCYRCTETIDVNLRAQWIQEEHPDIQVLIIFDIMDDENSKAWAEYTKKILGYVPDVVFSSEDYGEPYAYHLGCQHVLVDRERNTFPVCGTNVREKPLSNWEFLTPAVRGYYAKRVCVLGAESTGTTTMAQSLAEHYKTEWAFEFGRAYWEGKMATKNSEWRTEDFIFIAQEQNRLEDYLAKYCNKILLCDTNSLVTSLWHERYLGIISKEVEAVSENYKYDFYFLTGNEISFIQDGTRDGEHIRNRMHDRFKEELTTKGIDFVELTGSHNQRIKSAIKVCDQLLQEEN